VEVREVLTKMRLDEEGNVMDEAVANRSEIILRSYHCRLCYVSTFFSSYSIITVLDLLHFLEIFGKIYLLIDDVTI
jgi:hypothetical protein